MIQSLSVKGAEAGARGPRLLGECSTDYGGGRRRSTREPKRLTFPFEPRSENRGVHGILKAVPHVRSTFIFDVHVDLPADDSRKFTISLSSVSCRRGSTTWYGHSASSFCSQALRLSGSIVNLFSTTQR